MIYTKAKTIYGEYRTRKDNRYLTVWNAGRRSKAYKKISNGVVRRAKEVGNGGAYKKVFDYQWEMW